MGPRDGPQKLNSCIHVLNVTHFGPGEGSPGPNNGKEQLATRSLESFTVKTVGDYLSA